MCWPTPALALGLVAISFVPGARVDLSAWLFGDILAVGRGDSGGDLGRRAWRWPALLAWRWGPLVTATLSPELARSAGVDPDRERLVLTLALAVTVAVAMKVVGALLIGALLLIPAAAARNAGAQRPRRWRFGAVVLGIAATVGRPCACPCGSTRRPGRRSWRSAAGLFALSLPVRAWSAQRGAQQAQQRQT